LDKCNELRWDWIELNLPGAKKYNPSKPRVQKWNKDKKCIAGDISAFVDDGRMLGKTLDHVWRICRQVCSRFQYLGMQDATRKWRPPTRCPGAWAGAVFSTSSNKVTKSVTSEKWKKGKDLVTKLWDQSRKDDWKTTKLNYKELEVIRGFLGHLSMTLRY
jgi:hypothetical protein